MNSQIDAAHGGAGWSPRKLSLQQEIGSVWQACGVNSEWMPLKTVLIHRPGSEIAAVRDANKALMYDVPDVALAQHQHDNLAETYRDCGIKVLYVDPTRIPPPNQMYVADLFFMTLEGAIIARPASTIRAGEERSIARKLAELGIPILRCIRGKGIFEGADALWIGSDTVILGVGLRTNAEGVAQVSSLLHEIGLNVITVHLPPTVMHLMGTLRFVSRDIAIAWQNRTPDKAQKVLNEHGFDVLYAPDKTELTKGMALNFVTLRPFKILMPAGNPVSKSFFQDLGIECLEVQVDELHKAAGGIGCLTGILYREPIS